MKHLRYQTLVGLPMEDFLHITTGLSILIDGLAKISLREEISLAKLLKEIGMSMVMLSKDEFTLRKGLKLTKEKMKHVKTRSIVGANKQKRRIKVSKRETK